MNIAGILCEYNPLHSGHRRHIEITANMGYDGIVAAMSGNFVQRGDVAIYSKWDRAKAAIEGGANLVLEMPTSLVLQSAEGYARAGMKMLSLAGATVASFGSECGDADMLKLAATRLDEGRERIIALMKEGKSYPISCKEVLGDLGFMLDTPNNTLGIEYVRAINHLSLPMDIFTIKREATSERATNVRQELSGADGIYELKNAEVAMLARLRRLEPSYFSTLPDVTEGLEHRIVSAIRSSLYYDDIVDSVSSKIYTKARIRRILLRAFLNIPYIEEINKLRILALDDIGREIVKNISLPTVTKISSEDYQREAQNTDLYSLFRSPPLPCGEEFRGQVYYKKFR